MSDTAQDFQKLLTDTIRKQMLILGSQVTLTTVHNVPGLTVSDDGTVSAISDPQTVITKFVEQFRDLSAPLVKKTMQPLLSSITPVQAQSATQATIKQEEKPAE